MTAPTVSIRSQTRTPAELMISSSWSELDGHYVSIRSQTRTPAEPTDPREALQRLTRFNPLPNADTDGTLVQPRLPVPHALRFNPLPNADTDGTVPLAAL